MITDDATDIDEHVLEHAAAEHLRAEDEKKKAAQIVFLSDDELWGIDPPDESIICPGLGFAYGPPTILVGQSFTGKTLISMAVGVAFAAGKPVFGRYACKGGTYVHLDYEQGRSETKKRIQRISLGMGLSRKDLEGKIKVAIFPGVNLTTPKAVDEYVRIMTGVRLIVVDSLKAITPGVEENSSSLRDLIRVLTAASEKTKCAVIIIHHAGKGDEEDPRGSSAIRDEASTIYSVTGTTRNTKTIRNSKNRPRAELTPDFGLRFTEPESERMIEPIPASHYEEGFSLGEVPPTPSPLLIEVAPLDGAYEDRIVEWLHAHSGQFAGTRTQFVGAVGGRRAETFAALRQLETSNRLTVTERPAQIQLTDHQTAQTGMQDAMDGV